MTLRFLARKIQRMDLPLTAMGKTVGWAGLGRKIGILFDVPIRRPNGNVEYDAGCMSLEFKKMNGLNMQIYKVCHTDSHLSSPHSAFKWIL